MITQTTEYVTKEMLDGYITEAARTAGYQKGFGVTGCDLAQSIWWVGYCRQSLDQQSHNNRLPEYLLTLAKMARDQGVIVPREYIFYDHETGEHLDRPQMMVIRHELIGKRKIAGILFADLRCLSREPAPQQVFERVCEIMNIKLIFGDAPSGMDVGSQFARSALTFSNKLARLATNRNALAGNIGRVLKGWVPAHKAAYGYVYRREAEITEGRILIKKAWWEIDSSDLDSKPVPGSPADTIATIFKWLGNEGRSCFWAAKKLNESGIKGPAGGQWTGNTLRRVVMNYCYTGKATYNANARVPNPQRPLGDVTGAVKRTLIRPKPAGEAVTYRVPALVSEELWQKVNRALTERGRGRGKEGKVIQALLRNRIFCPRCGKPMVVRRRSGDSIIYYHCPRAYSAFSLQPCVYRRFVPGVWDEVVWDCVHALLVQNAWVEEKLSHVNKQCEDIEKLVKLEQRKIQQIQTKINKIREGFEGGIYTLEETKAKINGYQQTAERSQQDIKRLERRIGPENKMVDVEQLRRELAALAAVNLDNVTFAEKLNIIGKLNIFVYPSEDLKTMKIKCSLLQDDTIQTKGEPDGCRIIVLGSTGSPRTFYYDALLCNEALVAVDDAFLL